MGATIPGPWLEPRKEGSNVSSVNDKRAGVKPLPVLEVPKRDRTKPTIFPREDCLNLARRALQAESLVEAAAIIRETAEAIPEKTGKAPGWREYLLQLAKGLARRKAVFAIFSDKGNTKLPFVSFSALPFFTCPGMGECEAFCYSLRAWRYPAGFGRQLQNTLLLKFARNIIATAFRKIKLGRVLRLYVDGDFDSLTTIGFWMGLLEQRPDVRAYGYSKSWALLVEYDRHNTWPTNYRLNLSSGGRDQGVTVEDMMALPITRGQFVSVAIDYRPLKDDGTPVTGNVGFKRYDDPAYHKAVREAAREAGFTRVFSCPGKCGECNRNGHVCGGGDERFEGLVVAIGVH